MASGAVTIQASSNGQVGNSIVSVTPGAPVSIEVTPNSGSSPTVVSASTLQFSAVQRDVNGNEVPGGTFEWSVTDDTKIIKIDQNGLVYGVKVGTATVIVKANGLTGTSSITVTTGPPDSV